MLADENPVAVTAEEVKQETESQLGTEVAPEAPKRPEDMTVEERTVHAVEFLHQAIPAARSMVNNGTLTGVQAKRVLSALIESPLEQETPNFTTMEAQKIFNLACIIQNAKFQLFQGAPAMLSEVEKQKALEKAQQEAQAEANPENNEVKEVN